MASNELQCPACQFRKPVDLKRVPSGAKRVKCPKCSHSFVFDIPESSHHRVPTQRKSMTPPSHQQNSLSGIDVEGDLCKPKNLQLAILFVLIFVALLVGRLYFSDKAISSPTPNFVAASEQGIATQWGDQILVTDHDGILQREIELPDVIPTQLIWAGEDLWLADYRTHRILVIGEFEQYWLPLSGTKIAGHFKVVPDLENDRIFLSNHHEIKIFNQNGEFQSSFGQEGRSPGQLKFPNQFLLDEGGNLIIANTKSPGIDKFTPDGRFLSRIVTPTGHQTYQYPTNVALLQDRIATLEADGYLQKARIALYDRQGGYLGQNQSVENFSLIGDIAAWDDRIYASDLENVRVYAFSAENLSFLGDYSADLQRRGEGFRNQSRRWQMWSTLSLCGMLVLLAPILYFYVKFRKHQVEAAKAGFPERTAPAERLVVSMHDALDNVNLAQLGQVKFIAVKTHPLVDVFALICLFSPFPIFTWIFLSGGRIPGLWVLLCVAVAPLIGMALTFRTSWGCPVSLKKARKLLKKLIKNKGYGVMDGAEQVAIGFCTNKTGLLMIFYRRHLVVAEFDWFGGLDRLSQVEYGGTAVVDHRYIVPAFKLLYGDREKVLQATNRKYLNSLRTALERRKNTSDIEVNATERSPGAARSQLAVAPMRALGQNNVKAALLSALFPGLGQFFKRDIIRGAIFMMAFAPIVLTVATTVEPALAGTIDWVSCSVASMGLVLCYGVSIYVVSLWDALKN
ncbi:MAG: hypothetical protein C0616_10970 [Desulfuromonas sp.]|nr:MAG: hypothetical protein C0616_10970 [Desulfuromonas sp.]